MQPLEARINKTIHEIEEGIKLIRDTYTLIPMDLPLVSIGISTIEKAQLPNNYINKYGLPIEQIPIVLAEIKAGIGVKLAEVTDGIYSNFNFDILYRFLQSAEELKFELKGSKISIKEKSNKKFRELDIITNITKVVGKEWYALNPELIDILRKEEDYDIKVKFSEMEKILRLKLYGNCLDSFQKTTTDKDWAETIYKTLSTLDKFLSGKKGFPTELESLIKSHSKHKAFKNRQDFLLNLENAVEDYYLGIFDASGLNMLNRVAMEIAASKIIECYHPDGKVNIAKANKILLNLLREVDEYMHNYNTKLKHLISKELKKYGIKEKEILSTLGGDETIFAFKKNGISEKKLYEIMKNVNYEMSKSSLYGINLKFRAGFTEYSSGMNMSEALKRSDNALGKAKKKETKTKFGFQYFSKNIDVTFEEGEKLQTNAEMTEFYNHFSQLYTHLRRNISGSKTQLSKEDIYGLLLKNGYPVGFEYGMEDTIIQVSMPGSSKKYLNNANKYGQSGTDKIIEDFYSIVESAASRNKLKLISKGLGTVYLVAEK